MDGTSQEHGEKSHLGLDDSNSNTIASTTSTSLTMMASRISPIMRPPHTPRSPPTHFLSIPLITSLSQPVLRASMSAFRDQFRDYSCPSPRGPIPLVQDKAVRPVGTLHLTLGVMDLPNAERIDQAMAFLRNLDIHKLISSSSPRPSGTAASSDVDAPFVVDLTSLTAMRSPRSTSVLYAIPQDSTRRLLPFCQALQRSFVAAGFLRPEGRELTLHATVINTIYIHGRSHHSHHSHQWRDHGPPKIDARRLIDHFREWVWAEKIELRRVAMCKMGATKIYEGNEVVDEVYEEIAAVHLPGGQ